MFVAESQSYQFDLDAFIAASCAKVARLLSTWSWDISEVVNFMHLTEQKCNQYMIQRGPTCQIRVVKRQTERIELMKYLLRDPSRLRSLDLSSARGMTSIGLIQFQFRQWLRVSYKERGDRLCFLRSEPFLLRARDDFTQQLILGFDPPPKNTPTDAAAAHTKVGRSLISTTLRTLAGLLIQLGDPYRAIQMTYEALRAAKPNQFEYEEVIFCSLAARASAYVQLGHSFFGEAQTAIEEAQKFWELHSDSIQPSTSASLNSVRSVVLYMLGAKSEAKDALESCSFGSYTQRSLCRYYILENQYEQAIAKCDRAFRFSMFSGGDPASVGHKAAFHWLLAFSACSLRPLPDLEKANAAIRDAYALDRTFSSLSNDHVPGECNFYVTIPRFRSRFLSFLRDLEEGPHRDALQHALEGLPDSVDPESPTVSAYPLARERKLACWKCFKSSRVKLKQCSRCKQARYCCRDCQTEHWKIHRGVCRIWKAREEERSSL